MLKISFTSTNYIILFELEEYQVIIRGTKLVIPKELQRRVVDLAHEGHQGITKTKALLREKVWLPAINRMVEERVKSCLACQVAIPEAAREPLQMSPLPNQAWDEISVGFAELSTLPLGTL